MSEDLDFSWFDLSKYDDVQDFTLSDWFIQLSRRIGIKSLYAQDNIYLVFGEHMSYIHTKSPLEIDEPHIAAMIEQIKTDYVSIKHTPILEGSFRRSRKAVRGAQLWDLPFDNNESSYVAAKKWINSFSKDATDELESNMFTEPLCHSGKKLNRDLISVDLNVPEHLLVEQFKEFIRERKKSNQTVVKKFSESEIKSWFELKILPCIDLLIYAQMNKSSIPQHQLGSMLFPDAGRVGAPDIDVTDRVRRSVLPKARKLLTCETILALQHQLSA